MPYLIPNPNPSPNPYAHSSQVARLEPVLGPIYSAVLIFLTTFVMFNVLISLIMEVFAQVQAAGSSAEVPSVLSSLFTAVAVRAGQLRAAVAVVGEIKHRREMKRAELHYRLEKAGSGRVLRYMLLHGHHAALQRQQAALKTQRVHRVVKSFLETVAPRSERPERSEWFSRITSEGDRRKSRSRKVSEGARTGDQLRGVVRTRHSSPDPYIAPP